MDKAHILIVDDDRANINILGNMLATEYEIHVAMNGQQAIELLDEDENIDLLLLDINMPGVDGYEVCRQLKQTNAHKDIPIIFITANNNEEAEAKGLELGAVDYITKPFSQPVVMLRVKNHLELKSQRDFLAHLSLHDGLTGIANRARFNQYLEAEWQRALREQTELSLLLMDIDYFKKYNDFYGHSEGDTCLTKVAKTIADSMVRSTDLAARYGGEEFACILPNTKIQGAHHLAETVRQQIIELQIPHQQSFVESCVSLSIGVSSKIPVPDSKPQSLIESADRMLYLAKEKGRNRVVFGE